MRKILFCRQGIIAAFYTIVNKQYKLSLEIVPYGAISNARGYPIFYLRNKYGDNLKEEKLKIFLCYDINNGVINQISAEDWEFIEEDLRNYILPESLVCHIKHDGSIEDWLLADCEGLSKFFGKKVTPLGIAGRDSIKKWCMDVRKPYVCANESEGKKLISFLDIKKIVKNHSEILSELLRVD